VTVLKFYAYVDGDPIGAGDPNGEFGVWGALGGIGFDLALQLLHNRGNLMCVDLGSLAVSGIMGAITPGIPNAVKAVREIRYANAAIEVLTEQVAGAQTANRITKLGLGIARNEAAAANALDTVIGEASGEVGGWIFHQLEAPAPVTPADIANFFGLGKSCQCKGH